ncbi:glycosyltransferase, partial [bacterium]|nr:glycosyltransferase [Candidatus Elulimicrobium humile]
PIEWNWLPDEFGPNDNAKLLHYTLGAPSFEEFKNTDMADVWHKEYAQTIHCDQHNPR